MGGGGGVGCFASCAGAGGVFFTGSVGMAISSFAQDAGGTPHAHQDLKYRSVPGRSHDDTVTIRINQSEIE